jgi:hypothetical protein
MGKIFACYENEGGCRKSADDGGGELFMHLSFPDLGSHLNSG